MWDHFKQMEIKDRQEEMKRKYDKGKEIESNIEFKRISTLKEIVVFLDLLKYVNISLLNKVSLTKKFEEMVKWFIKSVIKHPRRQTEAEEQKMQHNKGRTKGLREGRSKSIKMETGRRRKRYIFEPEHVSNLLSGLCTSSGVSIRKGRLSNAKEKDIP
ncbi:hypothetical protein E3N88_39772 [Mikania micrantha]|uniref:Uncharacterized protein n=1 Tax=Mikania micrantha TaxID=192012 RepID=A0A5N6LKR2_9ASTR|nr:hypothetical protein E3N88_39772 [Mikania micrantha]